MPTVATSSFDHLHHLDVRGAASRSFFLDAEELCCNSVSFLGLGTHVTSTLVTASAKQYGNTLVEGDGGESDCLLLSSHSDDDLSPGHSNANGSNAMQFLLLDDDEVTCTHPLGTASEPVRKVEAPAACLPTTASVHPLIQQHSIQDGTLPTASFLDSSTMYCLAVVDEATGLPLRPATPEETWEVERCFVLQQQSELVDAGPPMEPQQCCLVGRSGSSAASEVKDNFALDPMVIVQDREMEPEPQPQPQQPQPQEQEQQEDEEKEEEEREEEAAAPVRNNNNKRPDQPQRRCGPCDNCGATESPQWRQGPAAKPLLCNACGMRFRRTNQLTAGETGTASGARGARANKKTPAPAAPTTAATAAASGPRPKTKTAAAPVAPQLPDAKRPRRAAAVAAAATVAAAIDACS